MAVSNSKFNLLFGVKGLNSLTRVRTEMMGVKKYSYIAFNSASRSMSAIDRQMFKSSNSISKSLNGLTGGFIRFKGALGLGAVVGLFTTALVSFNNLLLKTNSQIQTSKILVEEMFGSPEKAIKFTNVMQNMSASFGQDLNEVMASSRGLLQVMKQIGKGDVNPKQLENMLSMVMAVSNMDLENRGLSYTAFSFKEALQGMGRGDFRSLRNRLEINLGKETELAITNALKSGDLDKAIKLMDDGLKRIGINSSRILARFMSEGFAQNLTRLSGYIKMMFANLGTDVFKTFTKPLAKFNALLAKVFDPDSKGVKGLSEISKSIGNAFDIRELLKFINTLEIKGDVVGSSLLKMANSFSKLTLSFFKGSVDLTKSLFGLENNKSMYDNFLSTINKIGNISDKIRDTFDDVNYYFKSIAIYTREVVVGLTRLAISGFGSTPIMKLLQGLTIGATGGINAINNIINSLNKALGNTYYDADGQLTKQDEPKGYMQHAGSIAMSVMAVTGLIALFKRGGNVEKVANSMKESTKASNINRPTANKRDTKYTPNIDFRDMNRQADLGAVRNAIKDNNRDIRILEKDINRYKDDINKQKDIIYGKKLDYYKVSGDTKSDFKNILKQKNEKSKIYSDTENLHKQEIDKLKLQKQLTENKILSIKDEIKQINKMNNFLKRKEKQLDITPDFRTPQDKLKDKWTEIKNNPSMNLSNMANLAFLSVTLLPIIVGGIKSLYTKALSTPATGGIANIGITILGWTKNLFIKLGGFLAPFLPTLGTFLINPVTGIGVALVTLFAGVTDYIEDLHRDIDKQYGKVILKEGLEQGMQKLYASYFKQSGLDIQKTTKLFQSGLTGDKPLDQAQLTAMIGLKKISNDSLIGLSNLSRLYKNASPDMQDIFRNKLGEGSTRLLENFDVNLTGGIVVSGMPQAELDRLASSIAMKIKESATNKLIQEGYTPDNSAMNFEQLTGIFGGK